MNLESLLYVGVGLFFLDAIFIVIRGLLISKDYHKYLETTHPGEYSRMVYEYDLFKSLASLGWHKNSLPYFTFISEDDFGDPQIAIYKNKIRWSFYYFLINLGAATVFFILVALLLEYQR